MPNNVARPKGDRRPLYILLTIAALFAGLLGCGGGGGGGGGTSSTATTSTATTSTATTSTATTSTATTSTATTSTATTNATTTSETTGTTGSNLPTDRIFFQDASSDVRHVAPNGTDEQLYADLEGTMDGFAQSPAVGPAKVAFGHTLNPGAGQVFSIWTNSTATATGATRLTTSTYNSIGSMQFTPDGTQIVFTAAKLVGEDLVYKLYVISATAQNQTPAAKDDADDAFVSFNGLKIVYTNWPLSANSPRIKVCNIDGTGGAILTNTGDNLLPQYNKTGTEISFTSSRSGQFEIWKMASNGDNPVQVTNINSATSDRSIGSSYNGAGTEIAFTRLTLSPATSGLYTVPAAGGTETQIRTGTVTPFVFWTPTGSAPQMSRAPGSMGVYGLGTSDRVLEKLGVK